MEYNEFGQMTYAARANGTITRYNYDIKGRLSSLVTSTGINGETKNIQDVTYSFKVDNSISSVINTPTVDTYGNHESEIAYSYRYDGLSRLIGAEGAYRRDSAFEREYERQYTYSPNGNLMGKTISERAGSPTAPPVEDSWTYTYENHAVKSIASESTAYTGTRFQMEYDAAGNMTMQTDPLNPPEGDLTARTKEMEYDSYNRIRKVTNPDKNDELAGQYWYDDQGFRVRKIARRDSGLEQRLVEVLYPSMYFGVERQKTPEGDPIPDTGYAVNNIFLGGVRIAAVIPSGDAQYYLTDQVDSVKVVVDDDGKPVSRMEYLPYGETWFEEGNTNNAPKYNSQELDKETGYYFYNARHYDPEVSRFVTPDTTIPRELDTQSWNRFAYCSNNPIEYKDPTGHLDYSNEMTGNPMTDQTLSSLSSGPNMLAPPAQNDTQNNAVSKDLAKAKDSGVERTTTGKSKPEPPEAVDKLKSSQDKARTDPKYQRGAGGPFNEPGPTKTWCNQGTFDIIKETGGDVSKYTTSKGRWDTTANQSFDVMTENEKKGKLATATPQQAQELANEGITVTAAWKNPNEKRHGHMSTVRPSSEPYDPKAGPMISNVGSENKIAPVAEAFHGKKPEDVKYFYEPK